MSVSRLMAVCLAVLLMLAGAAVAQYRPAPPVTPVPTVRPTPLPVVPAPVPSLPGVRPSPTPNVAPAPAPPRAAPAVPAPPRAATPAPPKVVGRARLARALNVAPRRNMECNVTERVRASCPPGARCKLKCGSDLCPSLSGHETCEFLLECGSELVGRLVVDDPICKPRVETRLVRMPGGQILHLMTVPVGLDCDVPECVR